MRRARWVVVVVVRGVAARVAVRAARRRAVRVAARVAARWAGSPEPPEVLVLRIQGTPAGGAP